MVLRPSTKFIMLGYILCLVLAAAIATYLKSTGPEDDRLWWLLIVPAFLIVWVITRHMKQRLIKLEVLNDRVRYESGLLSKTTRTEQIVKLQDVRVDQTLGQRMMGIGDLSFETAGGSSRIMIRSIDSPQAAADHILELQAQQGIRPDAAPHAAL